MCASITRSSSLSQLWSTNYISSSPSPIILLFESTLPFCQLLANAGGPGVGCMSVCFPEYSWFQFNFSEWYTVHTLCSVRRSSSHNHINISITHPENIKLLWNIPLCTWFDLNYPIFWSWSNITQIWYINLLNIPLLPSMAYTYGCATCFSYTFDHQVVPTVLVEYLSRWHHLHWLQIWPPYGASYIASKFGHQVKPLLHQLKI